MQGELIQKCIDSLDMAAGDLWQIHENGDAMESLVARSIRDGVMQLLNDACEFREAMGGAR